MTGSLAIDRFRVVALAPCDHPDPGRIRHAIGKVDQDRLARSIGCALGNFGADDQRFIVLRRLEIASTEATIGDPDRLAGQLAEGICAALARLTGMNSGETIVVFKSPAARIAAFVTAAARGEAWGKWWFSDLDHLKLLPVSSAIRVAFSRDPAIGLEALGTLADADRASVVDKISNIDAGQLLEDFEGTLTEDQSEEIWVQIFALAQPAHHWPANKVAIYQLATLAEDLGAPPSRGALNALRAVADLRRCPDFRSLVAAISTGSAGVLAAAALRPTTLAAMASLQPETRVRLANALSEAISHERSPSAFTRFGGVLLLWPYLPRLPHDRLPEGPGRGAGLLGLIALSSLFGADESALAIEDPVLRQVLAVEPRATLDELAHWLSEIAPRLLPPPRRKLQGSKLPAPFSTCPEQSRRAREIGLAALEDFARRLPGLASASLAFLKNNVFDVGARVRVSEAGARAILERPSLDVLLSISGMADRAFSLPSGEMLELERSP